MHPEVLVALVATAGSVVTTWMVHGVRKATRTNHGKKLGEHVEDVSERLDQLVEYTHRRWHRDDNRWMVMQLLVGLAAAGALTQDVLRDLESRLMDAGTADAAGDAPPL